MLLLVQAYNPLVSMPTRFIMILSEVNITNILHIFIAVVTTDQNNILGNQSDDLDHLKCLQLATEFWYILIHGLN